MKKRIGQQIAILDAEVGAIGPAEELDSQ